ncbi:hypothetical protein EVAR_77084_1, partial [Eumeta japonica]
MATPPKLKCMQLTCNGCTTIKCSGVVHPTQLLANRHLVKLGLIKSERKKTLSIIAPRHHCKKSADQRKKRAHREERQSGVRAYAAIAEIAYTLLTEIREFMLPEDRPRFDELVYRREDMPEYHNK